MTTKQIEKLRDSVNILDIISKDTELVKDGCFYRGSSPFKEKEFMVSPQRQSFKCFATGHGGDVFKYIMVRDNCDFKTAVERVKEYAKKD